MLTITQLARRCKVSRATVLYYERAGLLQPAWRADNGYRWYGEAELARLQTITDYRAYGLPIASISSLLDAHAGESQEAILQRHFADLERTIRQLRQQQSAIVSLLNNQQRMENTMVSKERWVDIMKAAGFNEADMTRWHQTFEHMEPQEHQKFLESLGIDDAEIRRIRAL